MEGWTDTRSRAGVDYPGTWPAFREWFPDEAACAAFLEQLRWPGGFVCPACGAAGGWQIADGRWWMCGGCARKTSVTAGTIFEGTRTPLSSWFAAAWFVTSQKQGLSALGLQRALGLGSYQTAWMMLHRFRVAMVRPDRERLNGRVEVDETYVGGHEDWVRGRQTATKTRVAVAVEILEPKGFGRIRLQTVPDVSKASLIGFVKASIEPAATVRTDGWRSYLTLPDHGYTHERVVTTDGTDAAHVAMPGAHRVASLLKRWLLGSHQGAVEAQPSTPTSTSSPSASTAAAHKPGACSSTASSTKPSTPHR